MQKLQKIKTHTANAEAKKDPFPFSVLFLFIVYYMAQPFYQTYVSVYQSHIGMSKTVIGIISSVTALVMFFVKPMMGAITDKSKNKNRMVSRLLMITSVVILFFYLGYLLPERSLSVFILVACCMLLYQMFYGTSTTLMEGNAVEFLNERKSKWNFGHIRLGGTIGFMISALISSVIIGGEHYERMFAIMSFFCIVCAFWVWRLPSVPGKARKKEHVPYSEIFKCRPFLVMMLLQFTNSLGQVFFRFYNIYLVDKSVNALGIANGLGLDNGVIGILAFCNAILEIPFFWFAGRIRDKIGMRWFMFLAVLVTATKNFLLSQVTSLPVILTIATITGFSFVGTHFCTVNFLNDHMPKKMRSTAQACSGLVSQVFGAIIGGPLGGWLSDKYSTPVMMQIGAIIIACGGLIFFFLFDVAMKYHNNHYGPNMVPLGPDGKPLYEVDSNGNIIGQQEPNKE